MQEILSLKQKGTEVIYKARMLPAAPRHRGWMNGDQSPVPPPTPIPALTGVTFRFGHRLR